MKSAKSPLLRLLLREVHRVISTSKSPSGSDTGALSPARRKFISDAATASLGTVLVGSVPSLLTSCRPTAKTPEPDILDVAILGAGMAGLNCANHLLGKGINYRIFEASRRLGGRILTHYNDALQLGIFPEFGGDFIDSNHSDMLALASEFKLELIDLEEECRLNKLTKDVYFFQKKRRSEREIISEFKKIAATIAKDRDALGENYDTPEAIAFDQMPLSDYIASLKCAGWLKDLFNAAFVAEYGLDCTEQSTLNFLGLIDTDTESGFKVFGESDERYRIRGGNSKIIQHLTEKVGEDHIETHREAVAISEDDKGVYTITFRDGKTVVAKSVVCTIPFIILRELKLNVRGLSEAKLKCIRELGYGTNTKLVLGYAGTPWSNAKNKAMGYLFHPEIINGWDSSYNKTEGNTNGAYVCYFGGKYSSDLKQRADKSEIAPPTHSWNTALPNESVSHFVNELEKVFPKSKKEFLNKHVFVNWLDFPFAKSSYSCYKTGQWTTLAGLEMEPAGKLFFAGEHCSEEFQGFMNGAAETGRRAAASVLQALAPQAAG
jgi:monoamine oxidase